MNQNNNKNIQKEFKKVKQHQKVGEYVERQ